jgi:hypothetical protein
MMRIETGQNVQDERVSQLAEVQARYEGWAAAAGWIFGSISLRLPEAAD